MGTSNLQIPGKFILQNMDNTSLGTFKVTLRASIKADLVSFDLPIEVIIIPNKGSKPIFSEKLKEQLLTVKENLIYQLPEIQDPDEDKVIIEVKKTPIFVSWTYAAGIVTFIINPGMIPDSNPNFQELVGTHEIKMKLIDDSMFPQENEYSLIIVVVLDPKEEENSKRFKKPFPNEDFSILNVTETGIVSLKLPTQLKKIDNKDLSLTLESGFDSSNITA